MVRGRNLSFYQSIFEPIEEIDPAVIAIDPWFAPALDAVQKWGGKYVIISPNSLVDQFGRMQPRGEALWKYPV